MRGKAIVAQSWPLAGGGQVVLNVFHDHPDGEAIALLGPVVAAIEEYRAMLERRRGDG